MMLRMQFYAILDFQESKRTLRVDQSTPMQPSPLWQEAEIGWLRSASLVDLYASLWTYMRLG